MLPASCGVSLIREGLLFARLLASDGHAQRQILIPDAVVEGARVGRTVADLMQADAHVITREQCMEGIADMIPEVQVETTFPDGTKLVTLHDPIR